MDLDKISFNVSPNCGTRGDNKITHIILHCPVGTLEGCIATFRNPNSKVSAHYVVDRDGSIVQMVKLENTAWHAMHMPNLWSIGIENVDRYLISNQMQPGCMSDPHWFTNPQLNNLADLVATLMFKFNIPLANVMGHNDPWLRQFGNNHQDPGPYFPWRDFRNMVQLKLTPMIAPVKTAPPIEVGEPLVNGMLLPKWNPLKKTKKTGLENDG